MRYRAHAVLLCLLCLSSCAAPQVVPHGVKVDPGEMDKAIRAGDAKALRRLLAGGGDPDVELAGGWRPLHLAAQLRSPAVVGALLDHGADFGAIVHGYPALYFAYLSGKEEVVDLLLKHGARLGDVLRLGNQAIHAAARGGNPRLVERLLNAGADPNAETDVGATPLVFLVGRTDRPEERLETLRLLIGRGADPNRTPKGGETILQSALRGCSGNIVEELLAAGASVAPTRGDPPLVIAARNGCADGARALLERGADPNPEGEAPLLLAYRSGNEELVDLLLGHGAKADATGPSGSAVHYAAGGTNPRLLERLLGAGEDPNRRVPQGGETPLKIALDYPNRPKAVAARMARVLLERGADPMNLDDRGTSALGVAAFRGVTEVLDLLLDRGLDPNHRDTSGRTALHLVSHGNIDCRADVVERLLRAGADVNSRGNQGETPLSVAVESGCAEIVGTLIKAGARIDWPDGAGRAVNLVFAALRGRNVEVLDLLIEAGVDVGKLEVLEGPTPLHIAAEKGWLEAADLLVAEGHPVDARSREWEVTPLFKAARRGKAAMVDWLLAKGADPNGRGNEGTPLTAAVHRGDVAIARKLLEAGAKAMPDCRVGAQPLDAASTAPVEMVRLLLDAGADPAADWDPTPLLSFVNEKNAEGVKLLLERGANPNVQSRLRDMLAPLHVAAWQGNLEIVEILLEAGADPTLRGREGRTSLDFAVANSHAAVARALRQKMAVGASGGASPEPVELKVERFAVGGATATLQWTVNPAVRLYRIYASGEDDGVRRLLAETEEGRHRLDLEPGRVVRYDVVAVAAGKETEPSNALCILRPPAESGEYDLQGSAGLRHLRKLLEVSDSCQDSSFRVKVGRLGRSTRLIGVTNRHVVPGLLRWHIAFPDGSIERLDGDLLGRAYVIEFPNLGAADPDRLMASFVRDYGVYTHSRDREIDGPQSIPGADSRPPPPEVAQAIRPPTRTVGADGGVTVVRYGWSEYGGSVQRYTLVFGKDGVLRSIRVEVLARDVGAAEYYH